MLELIPKLSIFIFIIALGYLMKRIGVFKKEDGLLIGRVTLYVTLPAAIISNADNIVINQECLLLIAVGICANLIMLTLGALIAGRKDPVRQAGFMLNTAGYNIGNFSLPFVTLLFGAQGVAYLCMFDIGNAVIGLGTNLEVAKIVSNPQQKVNLKQSFKRLFSSVPFDTYMLVLLFSILHIKLPGIVMTTASTIGQANSFLAMFMIGLLFEIKVDQSQKSDSIKVILARTLGNLAIAGICWLILPIPVYAKKILLICLLSPVASVAPIFSRIVGYDKPLSPMVSTVTAVESIIFFALISILL